MVILDEIARERRSLADLFDTFDESQWAAQSLCGEWTIQQAAAHLLMPLSTSGGGFLVAVIKARGSFDVANDRQTRAFAAQVTPADISAGLRAKASHPFKPPTFGHEAPMTDLVLHGQDISRPLGISHACTPEALRTALGLLTGPKGKRGFTLQRLRLNDGLRFEADDLDWTHGDASGALVRGPAAAIAHVMSGRTAGLADLSGPGVDELRRRFAA
jgi:uncharacterized protein (TIGR03083 family)